MMQDGSQDVVQLTDTFLETLEQTGVTERSLNLMPLTSLGLGSQSEQSRSLFLNKMILWSTGVTSK